MANGMPPSFYPSTPEIQPAYTQSVAAIAAPPGGSYEPDNATWMGVYFVAAGVAATAGLLAVLAIKNKQEHEELQSEVDEVDDRLTDFQHQHGALHAALAEQHLRLQAQVNANMPQQPVYEAYAPGTMPVSAMLPPTWSAPPAVASFGPATLVPSVSYPSVAPTLQRPVYSQVVEVPQSYATPAPTTRPSGRGSRLASRASARAATQAQSYPAPQSAPVFVESWPTVALSAPASQPVSLIYRPTGAPDSAYAVTQPAIEVLPQSFNMSPELEAAISSQMSAPASTKRSRSATRTLRGV